MNNNAFVQKAELANATFNAMFNPNPENFSKFSTELQKNNIECSQLPDKTKKILKIWKDLGHELFGTKDHDKARLLYSQMDRLLSEY